MMTHFAQATAPYREPTKQGRIMKRPGRQFADKPGVDLARAIAQAALDKKGEEVVILDVRKLASFTEYFVIASGRSTRHVQGLVDAVEDAVGSGRRRKGGSVEGLESGHWVLLDYNDVVVHIFYHEVRRFYDLEGLWHEAPRVGLAAGAREKEKKT